MNPDEFLNIEDMQVTRTVKELHQWIKDQCEKFTGDEGAKEYFREHRGLTKQLLEEIVPLSRYAQAKYGFESNATLKPVIGNQPYEALVTSDADNYKVETTLAIDGYQEHHRMNILSDRGSVSAWGKIEISGTKHTEHRYKVQSGGGSDSQIYGPIIERIREAHSRKIVKTYDSVRSLVIGFEDFLAFTESSDVNTFKSMLTEFKTADKGSFSSIWIVGVSGNFSAEYHAN